MQKEKIENLLTLIKENPDLTIVPKVDSDVVADYGYSYWLGGWGSAEIDYMINGADSNNYLFDDRVYFYSYDDGEDIESEIAEHFEFIPNMTEEEKEEKVAEVYGALEWQKVIAVSITLPE